MAELFDNLLSLQTIFTAIIFVISLSLHEFAHAWMADRLGDPTPREQGRVTLNPLAHIDPWGFVLVFLIGFGWGRPVQFNPHYLKNPLQDELKIAMAGPAMNMILAFVVVIILVVYQLVGGI